MTADELVSTIQRAQSGDADAFITLVAMLQRDIRVLVATFGSSQSMVDHTVVKIWSHCRAHLEQCPATPVAASWFRRIACLHLQRRLEDDLKLVKLHDDQLQIIIIQAALNDFKNTISPSNGYGLHVSEKMSNLDAEKRLSVEQRYGQEFGLSRQNVPGQAHLTSAPAAISLFLARQFLDWLPAQQVSPTGVDGQFALLIDEYLSGQISPSSFNRLVTIVAQDSLRGLQLERQMRLDLVLTALLCSAGTDQARELVGRLDSIATTTTELEKIVFPEPASNRPDSIRSARRSSDTFFSLGAKRVRSRNRSRGILPVVISVIALIAVMLLVARAPSSTSHPLPGAVDLKPGAGPSRENDLATSLNPSPTAIPTPSPSPPAATAASPVIPVPSGNSSVPRTIVAISCGGSGVGTFEKDKYFRGGQVFKSDPQYHVRTAGVDNAAPEAVYQSERWSDNLSYAITDLSPGAPYTVRLHFAECYFQEIGQRIFSVSINGTPVLNNFDIISSAGGARIAVVRSFHTTATNRGEIILSFTQKVENPKINGFEIISFDPPPKSK